MCVRGESETANLTVLLTVLLLLVGVVGGGRVPAHLCRKCTGEALAQQTRCKVHWQQHRGGAKGLSLKAGNLKTAHRKTWNSSTNSGPISLSRSLFFLFKKKNSLNFTLSHSRTPQPSQRVHPGPSWVESFRSARRAASPPGAPKAGVIPHLCSCHKECAR